MQGDMKNTLKAERWHKVTTEFHTPFRINPLRHLARR
jgi:hypothetical protein